MRICPVDLARCDRHACASGICEQSGELPLLPCVDCGVLIVLRGAGICAECISVYLPQSEEA